MSVDTVLVGMVRDELARISDAGDLASRAQLRNAVGIGANDLEAVLATLREAGEATEVEPDGYRIVSGPEELDSDAARSARADSAVPEPAMSLDEAERASGGGHLGRAVAAVKSQREQEAKRVELTATVAQAIGKEGLGNLVSAGVEEAADAGVRFVLEVTP